MEKANGRYLSHDNTDCLKGIFAIFIVLHHLYQKTGFAHNSVAGTLLVSLGYLSVGVFFFLSGYGLMAQYGQKGKEYIRSFPRYRILPFYCQCLLLVALYSVFNICMGQPPSLRLLLQSLLFGNTVVAYGWYLQAILMMYVLFYFTFRFGKSDGVKIAAFTLSTGLYCLLCIKMQLNATWYISIFCLPFGVIWRYFQSRIDAWMQRPLQYGLSLAACGGIFLALLVLANSAQAALPQVFRVLCQMLSAIFFVALVLLLIMKIPIHHAVTRALGRRSLEIYVSQGAALNLLRSNVICIQSGYVYTALVLLGIALFTSILHPLFGMMNKKLKKKK